MIIKHYDFGHKIGLGNGDFIFVVDGVAVERNFFFKTMCFKKSLVKWYPKNLPKGIYRYSFEDLTEWRNEYHQLHRNDGPSIEFMNGDKFYHQTGNLHRLDGPAKQYVDGRKEFYLGGQQFSEEDWIKFSSRRMRKVKKEIK